ncbi:DnaJ domain-containing protein [bacterium]|nr:DnaJ domain-containing protein [bacterium]
MPVRYKDYYKILAIQRTASKVDIQQAYRKMARKYHPDLNNSPLAEERFKNINEAYEVLSDPHKRRKYDALGAGWREGQEFRPPPGWKQQPRDGQTGHKTNGAQAESEKTGRFSDFFETFFGTFRNRAERRQRQDTYGWARRGHDVEATMNLSLEEVYHSNMKTIEVEVKDFNGSGYPVVRRKRYDVKIPVGIKDGSKIRLANQGGKGIHGGQDGDLFIVVRFKPHAQFTSSEFDLETIVKIEPWQAALGAEIQVPTLEGFTAVQLPARTPSGKQLRLRDRGLPKRNRLRGDLYVKIEIGFPKFHSLEERKAYETLARIAKLKNRKP